MPVTNPRQNKQRARDEHGFTIVEILIAVTIVALVLGGVIYMIASSGRSQQRADVRQKMAAAADGLAQQVRSNKDWLDYSVTHDPAGRTCKDVMCVPMTKDKYSYHKKASGDPNFTSLIQITPIDSAVDGTGATDNDHIIPDLYRISVTISLSTEEQQVWGSQQPYNLISTIDSTQLGKGTGSLTVQVCRVTNQVDERLAVAGCKDKVQHLEMRYQPPCAPDDTQSGEQVPVQALAAKTLPLSCNAAIHATKDMKTNGLAPGSVEIEPATNVGFQIDHANGKGLPLTSDLADKTSDEGNGADGSYVFKSIGTGDYQIDMGKLPLGMELWKSHIVPQDLKVSIQNNQHAEALIIIRPVQGTSTYTVALTRTIYHYTIMEKTRIVDNITPDPIHQAAVHSRTTYTYLYAKLTATIPLTPGASWNGYLGMEPKSFDRYRPDGQGGAAKTQQHILPVQRGQPAVVFGGPGDPLGGLPTGLFSRPEQLTVGQTGTWGQLDKDPLFRGAITTAPKVYDPDGVPIDIFGPLKLGQGLLACTGVPCGQDYAYINPLAGAGAQTSNMLFNDTGDGECYVTSAVPQVPVAGFELMGGFERENSGLPGGDRCERDFMVNGLRVQNFFPNRDGEDGKIVLWRSRMDQDVEPPEQGTPPVLLDFSERSMIPPIAVPDITPDPALPTPIRTDISPVIHSNEALCVAALGGCPPPSPITTFSVNPLLSLSPPLEVPLTQEQTNAKEGCMKYMKDMNDLAQAGRQDYFLSLTNSDGQKMYKRLNCDSQCPVTNPNNAYSGYPDGYKIEGNVDNSANPDAHYGFDAESGGFTEEGQDVKCPGFLPSQQTYFEPPPAPPVEPRPNFTGPDPDTQGVPMLAVVPAAPVIRGGTYAGNSRSGVNGH